MRKLRQWTLNHPLQFVSVFMLVYFTWFSHVGEVCTAGFDDTFEVG